MKHSKGSSMLMTSDRVITGQEEGLTPSQRGVEFYPSSQYEGEILYPVHRARGRRCNGGISTLQTIRTMAASAMAAAQALTCQRHKGHGRRGKVMRPYFVTLHGADLSVAKARHAAKQAKKVLSEKSFCFVPCLNEEGKRSSIREMIEASLSRVKYYAEREEIALRAGRDVVSTRSFVGVGGVV